jgi:hypothetical protein
VRHAAGSWAVGYTKVAASRSLVQLRTPWTITTTVEKSPWDPDEIGVLLDGADLAVEATGLASFANMLSVLCEQKVIALVSAALYRSGSVARVRRQAIGDIPLPERTGPRHPTIPPGQEQLVFEPGCSSPVNNASPVAVASAAALTAEVAIDFLAGRNAYVDEVIDVYRALAEPPFDKLGRLRL